MLDKGINEFIFGGLYQISAKTQLTVSPGFLLFQAELLLEHELRKNN